MVKDPLNTRGQAIIPLVILLPLILMLVGVAIDLGTILVNQSQLQNVADFIALSAAQETIISHGQVEETAIHVAAKNGLSPINLTIVHPYMEDNFMVEITAKKKIKPFFLPIFGFESKTISARAVAELKTTQETTVSYDALDYAVFSGSTQTDMHVYGNNSLIIGKVHGNRAIDFHGKGHNVTDILEAVADVKGDLSSVTGTVINKSGNILSMPDFSFNDLAAQADRVFNTSVNFNNVVIDGIWLINGDVSLNGGRISGRGIILATGLIKMPSNSVVYSSANDLLALYSLTDITLSCTNNEIHGVLYAPNGSIRINGSYNTFYGALIANEVVWATKDIVINGQYDLRAPQAFITSTRKVRLVE